MKKIILGLLFVLVLTSCQQTTVTAIPTADEFSPYYGTPQPAKAIVNGKIYDSEIGTTMWIIKVNSDGSQVTETGDAFAIITPTEPIVTTSNLSFTLKLPIPINPTELWYGIFSVTEDEINLQNSKEGVYRWYPNYKQQPHLPLLAEQELTFSLDPGTYVLEVHAGWGDIPPHTELEADYGFLFEVQE